MCRDRPKCSVASVYTALHWQCTLVYIVTYTLLCTTSVHIVHWTILTLPSGNDPWRNLQRITTRSKMKSLLMRQCTGLPGREWKKIVSPDCLTFSQFSWNWWFAVLKIKLEMTDCKNHPGLELSNRTNVDLLDIVVIGLDRKQNYFRLKSHTHLIPSKSYPRPPLPSFLIPARCASVFSATVKPVIQPPGVGWCDPLLTISSIWLLL